MNDDRERLGNAYGETTYWVQAAPDRRFAIRPGMRSADLDALLAAAGVEEWAYVTACNPRSVRLAAADNAERMTRLADRVRALGLPHVSGAGAGADSAWPPEPSLLILGMAECEAAELAREFDQHAIVVGRRGERARLAWLT